MNSKNGIGNFWDFRVFDLALYWNRKLRNISNTANSKECVLHEEVGNFWGFHVFNFGPYTEIKNSKNLEILC